MSRSRSTEILKINRRPPFSLLVFVNYFILINLNTNWPEWFRFFIVNRTFVLQPRNYFDRSQFIIFTNTGNNSGEYWNYSEKKKKNRIDLSNWSFADDGFNVREQQFFFFSPFSVKTKCINCTRRVAKFTKWSLILFRFFTRRSTKTVYGIGFIQISSLLCTTYLFTRFKHKKLFVVVVDTVCQNDFFNRLSRDSSFVDGHYIYTYVGLYSQQWTKKETTPSAWR